MPPLVTRSRPWSKNWPKKVMKALNGADRPSSGAVFGRTSRVPTGIGTLLRSSRVPTGIGKPSVPSWVPSARMPSPAST
ncbi:hypothetical protein D3C78_1708540 [compost metagenome]